MSNILEDLLSQLGPAGVGKIAGALGSDQGATSKAIGLALPALIGGMARNASQPEGAQALSSALDDHGDGVMGQLAGLLGGSGILSHILGQKQEPVAQQVAKGSGLDLGAVMKLLPIRPNGHGLPVSREEEPGSRCSRTRFDPEPGTPSG